MARKKVGRSSEERKAKETVSKINNKTGSKSPAEISDVVAVRPFVPALNFELSLRFYVDLGFEAHRYGDAIASIELGSLGFLLQDYRVEAFAKSFMMQLMTNDLDSLVETH